MSGTYEYMSPEITRIKKIDQELAGVSFSVRKVSPSQLKQFREESLRTVTDDDLKDMDVTRYMRKNGILISGSWEDAGDKFVLQLMADWLVKQESSIEVLGAERVVVPKSALNERQRLCFENASREKAGAIESRLARDNVSSAGQNPIPFWSMGQLDQLISTKFQPGRGRDFIYVTNLSFMDTSTRTLMAESEEHELTNNAVLDGISMAMKSNPKIKFNEPGHTIANTDGNTLQLIDIVYDPARTPDMRMDDIMKTIMVPNMVDIIVTGQYLNIDEKNEIRLKPLAIDGRDKMIRGKTFDLKKSQCMGPKPVRNETKALCTDSHERIARAVKELLEAL